MRKLNILLATLWLFVTASAQTPTLDKTNYLPGSIGGSIDVSPTGVASYQIPITVAPGSNGMQPRLSINYSSQSGSGLLGWGWNLAGLSRIYKVNKNPYYDGTTQPAAVETLGALALDGTRLILSSTPNVYNPENDPYTKVTYNNNSFTVTNKDGLTMVYGTPIVPIGCKATEVVGWAISKITDYNGNYITFTYTGSDQTGEYLIDKIAYTGNGSKAPYSTVKFAYQESVDYSIRFNLSSRDTIDKYNGAPIQSSKVIESITNKVGEVEANRYTFTYSDADGHTKLQKVYYTTNGKKYNPTVISWNEKPQTYVASYGVPSNIPTSIWGINGYLESIFTDFNGDGITDIARIESTYAKVNIGLANGTGGYSVVSIPLPQNSTSATSDNVYSITTTTTFTHGELQATDSIVGGANRLYYHYNKTVQRVYNPLPNTSGYAHTTTEYYELTDAYKLKSTGYSSWNTYSAVATSGASTAKFYYRDIDNDGKTDRLTLKNEKLYRGTSTTPLTLTGISKVADLLFLDFDGDGQQEMLVNSVLGNTYYILKLNTGTATWIKKLNLGLGTTDKVSYAGDYNSDGRDDLLLPIRCVEGSCETQLYFFNQNNTGYPAFFMGANVSTVDDIDGDGINEFIYTEAGSIIISKIGKNFEEHIVTTIPTGLSSISSLSAVDINNDGQKELIYGLKYDNQPYRCVSFNSGLAKSNMVKSIFDGSGNLTELTYGLYSNNSTSLNSLPLMPMRGPVWVAKNVKVTNGDTTTLSNTQYTYRSGNSHQHLGFLGFKEFGWYNSYSKDSTYSAFEYTIPGAAGAYSPWLREQKGFKSGTSVSAVTNTMAVSGFTAKEKSFSRYISASTAEDKVKNVTTTSTYTFSPAFGRVTGQASNIGGITVSSSTVYEAVGELIRAKSVSTARGTYTNTVTLTYDTNPLRVKSRTERGLTTTYNSFDDYGNPESISVSDGTSTRTTTCDYDENGRFLKSSKNLLGQTTAYTFRQTDGFLEKEVSPMGTITHVPTVGAGAYTVKTTYPNGIVATSAFGWDNDGYKSVEAVTNGNTITTYFNALGQKVKQTLFGFKKKELTTVYAYSGDGSLSTVKSPGIATPTTYTYDNLGRVKRVSGHNGLTVDYTYSDLSVTETSSVSGAETKTYSSLGELSTVTSPRGNLSYAYYDYGKVKSITNASDNSVTRMEYDPTTLLQTKLVDPDAGATTYVSNAFGELKTQTDANGQTITCTYDGAGRLTDRVDDKGKLNEHYTYNSPTDSYGLLKTATRDGVTETYTYDAFGRTTRVETTGLGQTPYVTSLKYNPQQQLESVTHPTGVTIGYAYDAIGNVEYVRRLNASGGVQTTLWQGVSKNDREQWEKFALGNGLTTQYAYDPTSYQLSGVQTGTPASPTSVQGLGFTFNAKGQLTQRTEGSLKEIFDYDNASYKNLLTKATLTNQGKPGFSYVQDYRYEPNGNIQSTSLTGAYTYATGKPHAVNVVNATGTAVSQSGQLVTESKFTPDNRISEVFNSVYKNVFAYGPSGGRVKAEHYKNGAKEYTKLYVGSSEFIVAPSGEVKIMRTFVSAPTGTCAVYQDSSRVKTMHYVHTDYLGSWLAITDSTRRVENRYSYDAWGRPRSPSTWELLPISTASALVSLSAMQPRFDRGYTGHEGMAGFGLINMNGRLYDPYLQRFLSPDMYVQEPDNAQNYNRYTYCLNNPLMYVDPSGYLSMTLDQFIKQAISSSYGGYWESNGRGGGNGAIFTDPQQPYVAGAAYNDEHNSWEYTEFRSGAHVETVFIGSRYAHDRSRGFSMLSSFCDAFVSSFVANSTGYSAKNSEIDAISGADKYYSGVDYLVYEAQYSHNDKYRTQGYLIWYSPFGEEIARYEAVSGSSPPSKALYTLPAGSYTASGYKSTSDGKFMRHDIGFYIRLSPQSVWDTNKQAYRTELLIHPARFLGTEGCIGLIDTKMNITDFQDRIKTYLTTNKSINVTVKYKP